MRGNTPPHTYSYPTTFFDFPFPFPKTQTNTTAITTTNNRQQLLCKIPSCAKMYLIEGNITASGGVEFGYGSEGVHNDVLTEGSFFCKKLVDRCYYYYFSSLIPFFFFFSSSFSLISFPLSPRDEKNMCRLALESAVEGFAPINGTIYMLMTLKKFFSFFFSFFLSFPFPPPTDKCPIHRGVPSQEGLSTLWAFTEIVKFAGKYNNN